MTKHLKTLLTKAEAGDLAACAELEAELMIDTLWMSKHVQCFSECSDIKELSSYHLYAHRSAARLAASTSVARQVLESEE